MSKTAAKYQKYPEYKDSGVEWLGEIPAHWTTSSLSKLFSIKAGGDIDLKSFSEYQSDEYPYPIYTNANDAKAVYGYSKVANYRENSITVSGRGEVGFSVYRDHSFEAIIRLLVLTPLRQCHPKFFAYFINEVINFRVESSAIGQLSTLQISPYKAVIPSSNEQLLIINFLDYETAKIDTLIAKQEKLIELLKEKRQAVISHAVTKGLNPDVAMKDSGVEWLGEVPEHWEIGRLKNVLIIRNGRDYKNVEVEYGGYPVYGSGGIFKRSSDYLHNGVSILFGRKGTVDKPLLVNGKFWTVDTMFYSEISRTVDPVYIYYQSLGFPFDKLSTNTALPSMTQEDLLNLSFVIPPYSEQIDISNFIKEYLVKNHYLIEKAESAIQLMQERRTALISAAVTGKIDVRHWQAPKQQSECATELIA